jgi:alpha-galactosidase
MKHFLIHLIAAGFFVGAVGTSFAQSTSQPAHWALALTPPMGWNSYDAFGDSVTESEVMANAQYMKDHLLQHGWKYVVVDFRWYDPKPTGDDSRLYKDRLNAALSMDSFGRLQPAPNRFPSSADGTGFRHLADTIHAMGLKFGIHIMRGIPRMAVKANAPIEGSGEHAWDATNFNTCAWCPDMFGVDTSKPAGQAWYDSIFRQYAQWGIDFVKVDDLSVPYSAGEIEAIRKALDKCTRPIVFSTSPGPTSVRNGLHVERRANMWRISGDFWDRWRKLDQQFDLIAQWHGFGGPGHWPDADMIPFGHIAIRSKNGGSPHITHFTPDEQVTLMSLWSLAPSPLMLGGNLPDNSDADLALLSNDEVLAVDQDRAGKPAVRVSFFGRTEVWVKELADGEKAMGLFNRSNSLESVTYSFKGDKYLARDLWGHRDLGEFADRLSMPVAAHGAILLRLSDSHAH